MNIKTPLADPDIADMARAAGRASGLLRSLGNGTRLMILCHLSQGEKTVGALQALLGVGQSALSQHLARLRKDGLVRTRREAQTIHYAIASDDAARVIATLYDIYCGPTRNGGEPTPGL
jgi:DNA-binding transcriptional ArsR family regulator